jgi:hypothetical protein
VLEACYLVNARWLHRTPGVFQMVALPPVMLASIGLVLGLQALFTYAPFMQQIFQTRPLDAGQLFAIFAAGAGLIVLLEVEKRIAGWTGWFPELRS